MNYNVGDHIAAHVPIYSDSKVFSHLRPKVKNVGSRKYEMGNDITETRRKIENILNENILIASGGLFVVGLIIGVIEKIMKRGARNEIATDLKKIHKALENDAGMRTDPLVEKLLRLTKEMVNGKTDPRIKDVIAAVKQKYANPSLPDHLRHNL